MRKTYIVLYMMCLIAFTQWIGCGSGTSGQTNAIDVYIEEDPGSSIENCCGVTYLAYVGGESPTGGRYYWAALLRNDTMLSYGEPQFVPQGVFDSVELDVSISYLDQIPAGVCQHVVFASDTPEDVGDMRGRTIAADIRMQALVPYGDTCLDCCTKPVSGNNYKAFALKGGSAIDGAEATIETYYGRLCGEGSTVADTASAQQNCFACIQEHANEHWGQPIQAQIGWINIRDYGELFLGATTIDSTVYWEVTSNTGGTLIVLATYVLKPTQFSNHTYTVRRTDSVTVEFYYDGTFLDYVIIQDWAFTGMSIASWQGEIRGRETNMPGIQGQPCYFTDCRYWDGGTEHVGSFDVVGVTPQKGNRPDEWGAVGNGSTLRIWDVNPR